MDRPHVEASRRSPGACVALGLATALTLGFSASAGADDIACHGSEKPAAKTAIGAPAATVIGVPRVAPTPEELARLLANVRVERGTAACPAIDEPASASGVRAFLDPATGELREPTAEDWASLRSSPPSRFEKRARTAAATRAFALPGGGVAEVAGSDALTEFSVEIGPDGSFVLRCAQLGAAPGVASSARAKAKE